MSNFSKRNFIKNLLFFAPRQGQNMLKTADYIEKTLNDNGVYFVSEKFKIQIPVSSASLSADGKNIACSGCSFASGKITNKDSIASSLIPSRFLMNYPNINFNPKCDSISASNFYFAPAIAVSRKDIPAIINADKIYGEVKTKKYKGESRHILVGNFKNPKNIIFGHYDSVGLGAIDNASGVAVMMDIVVNNSSLLENNLFVFDGNEELSYSFPTYWGNGYRVFEKRHKKLIETAKNIFVVDCVGNGKTEIVSDIRIINLAFPILSVKKFKNKIFAVGGNIEKLMSVYHSNEDTIGNIKNKYLNETVNIMIKKLR